MAIRSGDYVTFHVRVKGNSTPTIGGGVTAGTNYQWDTSDVELHWYGATIQTQTIPAGATPLSGGSSTAAPFGFNATSNIWTGTAPDWVLTPNTSRSYITASPTAGGTIYFWDSGQYLQVVIRDHNGVVLSQEEPAGIGISIAANTYGVGWWRGDNNPLPPSVYIALASATATEYVDLELWLPVSDFTSVPDYPAPPTPSTPRLSLANRNIIVQGTVTSGTPVPVRIDVRYRDMSVSPALWLYYYSWVYGNNRYVGAVPWADPGQRIRVQVRSVSADGGVSKWSAGKTIQVPADTALPNRGRGNLRLAIMPGDALRRPRPWSVVATDLDVTNHLLDFRANVGRSQTSFLSQVASLVCQFTLDNRGGRYDGLLPGYIVQLRQWRAAEPYVVIHGWIKDITRTRDPGGRERMQVVLEGSLARLSREQWEFATDPLYDTLKEDTEAEYRYSGELIDTILETAGWPDVYRVIDRGIFHVYPYNLAGLLGSTQLRRPLASLRELERTEWGLLHESRGDQVIFEGRYHRELDTGPPLWTFGTGATDVRPIDAVLIDHRLQDVYTNVRYSTSNAFVHPLKPADRSADYNLEMRNRRSIVIKQGETVDFEISLGNADLSHSVLDTAELAQVVSVTGWQALEPTHVIAKANVQTPLSGNPPPQPKTSISGAYSAGGVNVFVKYQFTRTGCRFQIENQYTHATDGVIRVDVILRGRPVVNNETLAFVDLTAQGSEIYYEPKSLDIKSLVDVGKDIGSREDRVVSAAALREAADYILWRY